MEDKRLYNQCLTPSSVEECLGLNTINRSVHENLTLNTTFGVRQNTSTIFVASYRTSTNSKIPLAQFSAILLSPQCITLRVLEVSECTF